MANGSGACASLKMMKMLKMVVTLSLLSSMVLSTITSEALTFSCPAQGKNECVVELKNEDSLEIKCPESKLVPDGDRVCTEEVSESYTCKTPVAPTTFVNGMTMTSSGGKTIVKAPDDMKKDFKKTGYLACNSDSDKFKVKLTLSSADGMSVSLGVVAITLLSSFVALSS